LNSDAAAIYAAILSTAPIDCIKIKDAEHTSIHDIVSTLRHWRDYTETLQRDNDALQEMVDAYEKD